MKAPMKTKLYALLAVVALLGSVALAHTHKRHVGATLEKINPDSVVVKTAAVKSVEVKLVASTIYVWRDGDEERPAKVSDLAGGDRMGIHAPPQGETFHGTRD